MKPEGYRFAQFAYLVIFGAFTGFMIGGLFIAAVTEWNYTQIYEASSEHF